MRTSHPGRSVRGQVPVFAAVLGLALSLAVKLPVDAAPAEETPSTLQDLIDRARPGGVVEVPAGTHAGPLRIEKSLKLAGQGMDDSIVELVGDEPAITVRGAKKVLIENLAVRWSQKSTDARLEAPAAIYVRDSVAMVRKCRLEPVDRPEQTPYGLLAAGRTEVTFTEGRTTGFAYTLIFLDGANGTVTRSHLSDAGHSVVTLHEHSRVKIQENVLGECGYHAVRNTGGTMEMESNLVVGNYRAGAYLGNKPAHGHIRNNLFMRSRGEIWGYSRSDVTIENNLFLDSRGPGVGMQPSCRLVIRRNSFVGNEQGVALWLREGEKTSSPVRLEGNHYWQNGERFLHLDGEAERDSLSGDPKFADAKAGDFRAQEGSPLLAKRGRTLAGLTDPETIQRLWATWTRESDEAGEDAPTGAR